MTPLQAANERMQRLTQEAARAYGVSVRDVKGPSRMPRFAKPRQAAMVLARDAGISREAVARFFDRDHTSVDNALRRVGQRMNPELRGILDTIKQRAEAREVSQ